MKPTNINPSLLVPTESINWSAMPDNLNEYKPMIVWAREDGKFDIMDGHHRFMFIHHSNRRSIMRPNGPRFATYPAYVVNNWDEFRAAVSLCTF